MMIFKSILGGILAIVIAGSAMANSAVRPFSRDDAVAAVAQAEVETLANFRVVPRPDHMIRYPVEVHQATTNLPVTPQKLYLSFWGSDTFVDWMGPFETPSGPLVMEVDWTAFTPLGAACQFPESLLCKIP